MLRHSYTRTVAEVDLDNSGGINLGIPIPAIRGVSVRHRFSNSNRGRLVGPHKEKKLCPSSKQKTKKFETEKSEKVPGIAAR